MILAWNLIKNTHDFANSVSLLAHSFSLSLSIISVSEQMCRDFIAQKKRKEKKSEKKKLTVKS